MKMSIKITQSIAYILVVQASMCLLFGMIFLFLTKATVSYDYIHTVLLTGILSGLLVIVYTNVGR